MYWSITSACITLVDVVSNVGDIPGQKIILSLFSGRNLFPGSIMYFLQHFILLMSGITIRYPFKIIPSFVIKSSLYEKKGIRSFSKSLLVEGYPFIMISSSFVIMAYFFVSSSCICQYPFFMST